MDDLESSIPELNDDESPASKLPLIALIVGIAGIVVGVFAFISTQSTANELAALKKEIESRPDETPALQASIDDIEERLVKLGSELVKLNRQDRQIRDDSQDAFNSVSKEIKENRTKLNEMLEQVSEAIAKLETAKAQPVRTTSTPSSISTPPQIAEEGIHLIEPGDTLGAIAKKYGISLSALMNANPSINPRSLQIGQRINIPQ